MSMCGIFGGGDQEADSYFGAQDLRFLKILPCSPEYKFLAIDICSKTFLQ